MSRVHPFLCDLFDNTLEVHMQAADTQCDNVLARVLFAAVRGVFKPDSVHSPGC